MPGSVVNSMKRVFADLAPEILADKKTAEAKMYQKAAHQKADAARGKESPKYDTGRHPRLLDVIW